MKASATTVPALAIFFVSVVTRSLLQYYGGPGIGDISWITTFGVVAAAWLGLGGQIASNHEAVKRVEKQTNGLLTKKVDEVAERAAETAVSKVLTKGDEER